MAGDKQQSSIPPLDIGPLDGKVYAMPEYYLPKAKSGGMSQKTLLLIVIGVIFVLIVVVFSVILLRSNQSSQITSAPTQEVPVITPPIDEPAEPVVEDEEPEEEEEEPEEPIQEVEDRSDLVDLPVISLPSAQTANDTDQDGLTDEEETIFSTSAAIPDTDQDSFLDGAEVVNLYDPATPGALLEISPIIEVARNVAKGYQLLIPSIWSSGIADPGGNEFIVRPGDGTDSFSIKVYDNPERMTPVQWYQQQQVGADLGQFNNFSNEAGWNGIQSQDGRVVIATFGSSGIGARAFIFVMHYDPGQNLLLRYSSVWNMMLQSLSVLDEEVPLSGSTSPSQ